GAAHRRHGADAGLRLAASTSLRMGLGRGRACRGPPRRGAGDSLEPPRAAHARVLVGVPSCPGQNRLLAPACGLERRLPPRPGLLPVLPLTGGEPQADLRPDGNRGHLLRPPGWTRAL